MYYWDIFEQKPFRRLLGRFSFSRNENSQSVNRNDKVNKNNQVEISKHKKYWLPIRIQYSDKHI